MALHPAGTALTCTLTGHSGVVSAVAVTPDGQRAVSACWDKTLKVWDLAKAPRKLSGARYTADHLSKVWDLASLGKSPSSTDGLR